MNHQTQLKRQLLIKWCLLTFSHKGLVKHQIRRMLMGAIRHLKVFIHSQKCLKDKEIRKHQMKTSQPLVTQIFKVPKGKNPCCLRKAGKAMLHLMCLFLIYLRGMSISIHREAFVMLPLLHRILHTWRNRSLRYKRVVVQTCSRGMLLFKLKMINF